MIGGEGGIRREKAARCLVGGRIHWRQVLSSAAEFKELRIRCAGAEAALLAAGLKLIRYGLCWGGVGGVAFCVGLADAVTWAVIVVTYLHL